MSIKKLLFGCVVILLSNSSNLFAATLNVPFPYPTIQTAIQSASNGDTVRVAPGTYLETIDFLGKEITVVSIGGASVTTIDANQLDTVVYFWNNETNDSILDGFTLTGGTGYNHPQYGRHGGGMFIMYSNPTIKNCIVTNNSAVMNGGGGYVDTSSPIFENCTFSNNASTTSWNGGGLYLGNSNASFSNCTFTNNSATWGGGLYVFDTYNHSNAVTIENCLISENSTTDGAGGLYISQRGGAQITNCTISQNQCVGSGGGCIANGNLAFSNCIIKENTASSNGGGIDTAELSGNSPSFTDCVIQNNTSTGGPGGGGVHAWVDNTSVFTRCTISGNLATSGGGIRTEGCAPTFNGCHIYGNSTPLDSNNLGYEGGGIYIAGNPAPIIANSTISGNTAVTGGGVHSVNSNLAVINSIIYANEAVNIGGGMYLRTKSGNSQFHNSIIWGNKDILGSGESSQIWLIDGGSMGNIDVSDSIIEHWSGILGGTNNSGIDPRWVNQLGDDGIAGTLDDDLHLYPTSPCIDAGDNANVYGNTDIDGNARFLDDPYTDDTGNGTAPIVDIGPDEYEVAIASDAGPRLWMDSGMPSCMFDDTLNWLPSEVPDLDNLAMFEVEGEANVCLSNDTTVEQLIIANGDIYIDLGGMTLTSLGEVRVAPFGGKIANLTVTGGSLGARDNYVEGTLVFDSLDVGGGGIGSFSLDENVSLIADEILMRYGATIEGEPTIESDIKNFGGKMSPGTVDYFDPFDIGEPGSIVIEGEYAQTGSPDAGSLPRIGSMEFNVGVSIPGNMQDHLTVAGHATLGGIFEVNFHDVVSLGDSFDVFSATSTSDNFDFIWARGLPENRKVLMEDQFGVSGSGTDFTIGVANTIMFGSVGGVQMSGVGIPTDMLVVDLHADGDLDVVVSRMGSDPNANGVVQVYFDIENNINMTQITVGIQPQGLVADDFDGDGDIDLAVANAGGDSISVLTNNGSTFLETTFPVSSGPVDIAVGNFIESSDLPDLAVASTQFNAIDILKNTSTFRGNGFENIGTMTSGAPSKIDPGDTTNPKDLDVIIALSRGDNTTSSSGVGDGLGALPLQGGALNQARIPIGIEPLELAVGNINSDGMGDTVTINGDNTVSVRLGDADVAATIAFGTDLRGLALGDIDNDGDDDILVSATDSFSGGDSTLVYVIRNDTNANVVSLSVYVTFAGGVYQSLMDVGDVNGDGLLDLIAISEELDEIIYWLNEGDTRTCTGDLNDNGTVDVDDLLLLIGVWGDAGGAADLNEDGVVDVDDLLILISAWGSCD